MLNVARKQPIRLGDRVSRRNFLRIGGLGAAGLTLPDLLRLRAQGATRPEGTRKSVIMIYLPGGPSHIDMYDMKPEAPANYRGEFNPVRTNVPGIDICEHMPQQAKIADKLAIIQGLKTNGAHDSYELLTTDRPAATGQNPPSPLPAFGCVVSRVRGVIDSIPPYVGIKDQRLSPAYDDPETPAYLGAAYRPFRTTGPGLANLTLPSDVTLDRLAERTKLLRSFDNFQRGLDVSGGALAGVDSFTSQAIEIIRSNKVRDAFDLTQEPKSVRSAYGGATDFLLARRLVEAGVSVVSVRGSFRVKIPGPFFNPDWDTHAHNFKFLRLMLPMYDQAVAALINDLDQRGMHDDVTVVVWGEFGRQPKVGNVTPDGRGHWPEAGSVFLSGGGLQMGQIVGQTDRKAERAKGRPFRSANILATLYHALGIDPSRTLIDNAGRPRYILDDREPIKELL
jgi:hypothetical protein